MTWKRIRLHELHARRFDLSVQLEADQVEPCEEVKRVKLAITRSQIALNELHIAMILALMEGEE